MTVTITFEQAKIGDSLMEVAKAHGVEGVLAECSGSMICGTCHVIVEETWYSRLPAAEEIEQDVLDGVNHRTPTSRLSCQVKIGENLNGLIVKTPPSQY